MKKSRKMDCIPLQLTDNLSRRYPGCWEAIEDFREYSEKDGLPGWDKNICYIPIAATIAIVTNGEGDMPSLFYDSEKILDAALMAAVAPWRQYKQIFEFAPEIESLLVEQIDDSEIPVDVLRNLPYPSIYIKTNTIDSLDGAFVHIEHDVNTGRMELRLTLIGKDAQFIYPVPIHLIPGGTIKDGIDATKKESKRVVDSLDIGQIMMKKVSEIQSRETTEFLFYLSIPFVQFVLYLCAQNSEVQPDPEQEKIVQIPKSKELIQDNYREIRTYQCGDLTARQIRVYESQKDRVNTTYIVQERNGIGTMKSPHVRRGHWHHYWAKKEGEKALILKWQPPTFVHPEKLNEGPGVQINKVISDHNDIN